ncbi:MAG: heparinase II/III family protein [Verrucomicrobiota bacterium JB022]|nr:heparinase II/III family protein [Verrucomicrobiota bacterium JB022]
MSILLPFPRFSRRLCAFCAVTLASVVIVSARDLISLADPSSSWNLFVPAKAADAHPDYTLKDGVARLSADAPARFALQSFLASIEPGQTYRVGAEIGLQGSYAFEPKTPGVLLRLTFFDADRKPLDTDHLHFGLDGRMVTADAIGALNRTSWPEGWHRIDQTFTAPERARFVQVALFMWSGQGPVQWRGVEITDTTQERSTADAHVSAPAKPTTSLEGWNATLPEQATWAAGHPRVVLNDDKLAEIRQRIAVAGPARDAWQRLLAECDRYVTPGDSRYKVPAKAFADYAALDATTHQGRSQMEVALRRWTTPIELLAFAYAVSGRDEYGDAAAALTLAGVRRVKLEQMEQGFFLTRSFLARASAFGLDWCYDRFSPEERQELRLSLGRQVDALYQGTLNGVWGQSSLGRIWNWNAGSSAAWGLAALVLEGETDFPVRQWIFQAARNLEDYLDFGIDSAGGVIEGPVYFSYGAGATPFFIEALRATTGEDLYTKTHYAQVMDWMRWEILPSPGRVNNLMDSDHVVRVADPLTYARFREADPTANWIWRHLFYDEQDLRGGVESLPALVLWSPTAEELAQATAPAVEAPAAFAPGRGLAVSRTGWGEAAVMFTVHAQQYTEFKHDQADKGQFTLYAYGQDFAVDSGYGNDSKPDRSSSAFAHNLVLVDGQPQLQGGAHARTDGWIRSFLPSPVVDLTKVDQEDAYEFFYASNFQDATYRKHRQTDFARAMRTTLFVREPLPYVLIYDDIQRDEEPYTYSWLLHTAADTRVTDADPAIVFQPKGGDKVAHMELYVLNPQQFALDLQPFETTRNGKHPRLAVEAEAVRPQFIHCLLPIPPDLPARERPQFQSASNGSSVITWPDGQQDWVGAGQKAGPSGWSVDADAFWVRLNAAGELQALAVIGCRRLAREGRNMILADPAGDFVLADGRLHVPAEQADPRVLQLGKVSIERADPTLPPLALPQRPQANR